MYHNLEPLEGSTETGDIDPLYSSQSHAFCAKVKQLFVGYGGICLAIVGVVIVAIVIGLTVHAYHRTTPGSQLHDGPVVTMKCGLVEGSLDNETYVFKVSKQFMFFRVAPFRKRVRLHGSGCCLSTCPCSQPSPPLSSSSAFIISLFTRLPVFLQLGCFIIVSHLQKQHWGQLI